MITTYDSDYHRLILRDEAFLFHHSMVDLDELFSNSTTIDSRA